MNVISLLSEMSVKVGKEAAKVFSKTINSPKTAFPMYANPATREKLYLKKCTSSILIVDVFLVIRSLFVAITDSICRKWQSVDYT